MWPSPSVTIWTPVEAVPSSIVTDGAPSVICATSVVFDLATLLSSVFDGVVAGVLQEVSIMAAQKTAKVPYFIGRHPFLFLTYSIPSSFIKLNVAELRAKLARSEEIWFSTFRGRAWHILKLLLYFLGKSFCCHFSGSVPIRPSSSLSIVVYCAYVLLLQCS